MKMPENKKLGRFLAITGTFILLDRLAKLLILKYNLDHTCNSGIAFGIKLPEAFLFFMYLVIFLYLVTYLKTILKKPTIFFPTSLIIAGAFSNLIDRIFYGCVIDFINLSFWPSFNLADTMITIGAIMILATNLKSKKL